MLTDLGQEWKEVVISNFEEWMKGDLRATCVSGVCLEYTVIVQILAQELQHLSSRVALSTQTFAKLARIILNYSNNIITLLKSTTAL